MARTRRQHRSPTEVAAPAPALPERSEARWRVCLVAAVLAAAAVLVYLPSLQSELINWDDDVYVIENRHLTGGLSWRAVGWAFTSLYASNWHPLTWLTHAADMSLYRLDRPWGHHLTNLLLHAANTVLLLVVLRRLTGRLWPSAVVAGLFALHPLHVESVAWVAERKDLLCTLFMFLAMWAYAGYAARPSWRRYLLVAAAFAAALMSKPMAVTLPVVLLILDYWPLGRLSRRSVLEKTPLLAMSAISSAVTLYAQRAGGAVRSFETLGLDRRVTHAIYACGMYLVKMVWPWPGTLVPTYPLAEHGGPAAGSVLVLLLLVMLGGITALAVRLRRTRPYVLAGWLIYLVMLVPVSGLVQVGKQVMADRYTYVPLVGVFIAVVFALGDLAARSVRLRRAAAVVAVAALAVLGALAWHQQAVWRDAVTFWSYVARAFPRYDSAHNNLGKAYAVRGDEERALECYRKAVAIKPTSAMANANVGNKLLNLERYDEALDYFRRALAVEPDFVPAHNGIAKVMLRRGRVDDAMRHLELALQRDPHYWPARINLGVALERQQRPDEAIREYERVIRKWPHHWEAYRNLAVLLQKQGRTEEATHYRAEAERVKALREP